MNTEGGKILDNEDPIMVAIKIIAELQDRIETGERFTGISPEAWAAIPDEVTFQGIRQLLRAFWSEKWGRTHSITHETSQDITDKWRGCDVTKVTAAGAKRETLAVVVIPDNPATLVYVEGSLKLVNLEFARQEQIIKAVTLIKPFMKQIIGAGRPRKQIYDEAVARLEAGEPYDQVLAAAQNEDFDISETKFYGGVYRRGWRKRKKRNS